MTFCSGLRRSLPHFTVYPSSGSSATLLIALVLLIGVSMTSRVAVAQKGKPTPPPTVVLPTARYMIQWLDGGTGWEQLIPWDMNQSGSITGLTSSSVYDPIIGPTFSCFAYSESTGPINLNNLAAPWDDLNASTPTSASGWRVYQANGINDWGDISGTAEHADPTRPKRAFVLIDAFGTAPRFWLLPTVSGIRHDAFRINNLGETFGGDGTTFLRWQHRWNTWPYYVALPQPNMQGSDINDDGVIVGGPNRQILAGSTPEVFSNLQFSFISNNWMTGSSFTRNKRNGPIRLPALGTANDVQPIPLSAFEGPINDQGDTAMVSNNRVYLFYDKINPATGTRYGTNGNGLLPLDQMVVNPDATWADNVFSDPGDRESRRYGTRGDLRPDESVGHRSLFFADPLCTVRPLAASALFLVGSSGRKGPTREATVNCLPVTAT